MAIIAVHISRPDPRVPGQYRIDLDAELDLSVNVEVLGCRFCEPDDPRT